MSREILQLMLMSNCKLSLDSCLPSPRPKENERNFSIVLRIQQNFTNISVNEGLVDTSVSL